MEKRLRACCLANANLKAEPVGHLGSGNRLYPVHNDSQHHPLPVLRVAIPKTEIGSLIVAVGGHVPPRLAAVIIVGRHAEVRVEKLY